MRRRDTLSTALDVIVAARLGRVDAVTAATEAVALEPLREGGHVGLMRALASIGDRAKALRAYESCRVTLAEELGVDPSPQTEATYLEILREEAPSRPVLVDATERGLPTQAFAFVGRVAEVAAVLAALEASRLVTITGPGGAGKTRLALQVAPVAGERFADGARFVDLSSASNAAEVGPAILAALGSRVERGRAPLEALGDVFAPQELLLVLDNCEQVAAASAAAVELLLERAPLVRVLVTSRTALNATGEVVWSIPPMASPSSVAGLALHELATFEAVTLFCSRAAHGRPGFALSEDNADDVATICVGLDGMPLAIELRGGKGRDDDTREIATRLDQRLDILSDPGRMPRQRTLRALIDWSYELLDLSEQRLLSRIAVFVDGFSIEAAEAICGAGPSGTATPLAALLAASLLQRTEEDQTSRYRLLQTVRTYAAEHLNASGERAELEQRHASWFAEQIQSLRDLTDDARWQAAVAPDLENYRAALRYATEHGRTRERVRICPELGRLWHARGLHTEALEAMEAAIASASRDDRLADPWPRLLSGAVAFAFELADYARAAELAQQAVDAARALGDAHAEGNAMHTLGYLALIGGDRDDGVARFDEVLTFARSHGNEGQAARALLMIGYLALGTDVDAARGHLEEAVAIFRVLGSRLGTAQALLWLGDTYRTTDFERAQAMFEEALVLTRQHGAGVMSHLALLALAGLLTEHGQPDGAHQRCIEGLTSSRIGDRANQAHFLERLGHAMAVAGDGLRGARFLAAAATAHATLHIAPASEATFDERVASARVAVADDARFERAWAAGLRLSLTIAVAEALA